MTGRVSGALALTALYVAGPLAAQNKRCQLVVENVERQGVLSKILGSATENYFAGGNVRLKCRSQPVRIWADSIASYAGQVVQFIGHFRYEDETAKVTSDFGTYYKDTERWDATGNVVYLNTEDGSKLEGPMATYRRRIKGVNELEEVFAERRPRLTLAAKDSASRAEEPYVVVGDRIRMRGRDLMWAGGTVTIDRTDLRGRGDSLQLDNGLASTGALIGHASIRRAAADSFALEGKRIDLGLKHRELTGIVGRDSAKLNSKDLDLFAEFIALKLEARQVVQTLAWGKVPRPQALADDYQVRGDSLAVDTPKEQLRELRAFRNAGVGFKPDSGKGERDYLTGDSIIGRFVQRSTATGPKSSLQQLEARHNAASFYRMGGTGNPGGRPTLNYARAMKILLIMLVGDSIKVDRVEMVGQVDGMQLQPKIATVDSLRRDTTAIKPVQPKGSA